MRRTGEMNEQVNDHRRTHSLPRALQCCEAEKISVVSLVQMWKQRPRAAEIICPRSQDC